MRSHNMLQVLHKRRRLRQAALVTRALASSSAAATAATAGGGAEKRHKVIVVGGGRMGMIRAAAFFGCRKTLLAGMVESNPTKAKELSDLYHTPIFPDLTTALKQVKQLAGVWVATPTPSHKDTINQIIDVGGPAIGVEKPVCDNIRDIIDCYNKAQAKGVPLFCSFQRRTDPSYQKLLTSVRSGEIGTVRSIHCVFRDHPVPTLDFLKLGGDIYHDLVVHDADFIMHLLGELPEKVYAKGSAFHPELIKINVLDSAHVMLIFQSGVIATIELSRSSAYGYDQRIEVFGSDGMLQLTNQPTTQLVTSSSRGIAADNPMHSFPQRFAQAYLIEVDHFADVISRKVPVQVSLEDSIHSTRVAELCGISASKGHPVSFDIA